MQLVWASPFYRFLLYSCSAHAVAASTGISVLSPSIIFVIAQQHSILVSGILAACAVLFTIHYLQSPWRKLPPGPRGIPLLGNVLQLRSKPWLIFTKWKQDFGQKSFINFP